MKAGVYVDRAHAHPGVIADRQRMIDFASRWRGAMHEVGDQTGLCTAVGEQTIAFAAFRQIADPGDRQRRIGRRLDRRFHCIGVDVGKHGAYAFGHQCQRDGAADAVAGAGDQRGFIFWIERQVEDRHAKGSLSGLFRG